VTSYGHVTATGKLHLPVQHLQALQLTPANGPLLPADTLRCMAAFKLDGCLLPVQQRVELKLDGDAYLVKGWPGAAALIRHASIVGCESWLPAEFKHGGDGSHGNVTPMLEEGAGDQPVTPPVGQQESGSRSNTTDLLPGLLVICLQTVQRCVWLLLIVPALTCVWMHFLLLPSECHSPYSTY
jgi:hypothetical protein